MSHIRKTLMASGEYSPREVVELIREAREEYNELKREGCLDPQEFAEDWFGLNAKDIQEFEF